jgi:hypothetical protein
MLARTPAGGGNPANDPAIVGPSGVIRPSSWGTGPGAVLPPQPTPANQVGPLGGPTFAGNIAANPSQLEPYYVPLLIVAVIGIGIAYLFLRKK